jgi:hypothetical protein
MAIIKTGTFTVTTGGAAQNLTLGFVPSFFQMTNTTQIASPTSGRLNTAFWYSNMANGTAYTRAYTSTAASAVDTLNLLATNGFTPLSTTDSSLWTNTKLTITGISKAANASITATHAFTSADVGVTTVTFSGIVGMTQMNTLRGVIQSVTSTTSFTVNINSTSFTTYVSGGQANIITGKPASTTSGFQIFNTPQKNAGVIGLTMGTSLMVTTGDVWLYQALLDTPVTS